jgi:hypothetical protein
LSPYLDSILVEQEIRSTFFSVPFFSNGLLVNSLLTLLG